MSGVTIDRVNALRRLSQFGFTFFLIKGLAWLASPLILYWLV